MTLSMVSRAPILRPRYSAGGGGAGESGGNAGFGWSTPTAKANGVILTLTTNGDFGSGPTEQFFDDWSGATIGNIVSTANTDFGFVYSHGPKVAADSEMITGKAVELFGSNPGNSNIYEARIGEYGFSAPATEVYVSQAWKVPPGKYYPGATAAQTFPAFSSCKQFWLFRLPNVAGQTGDNDVVVFNHAQGNGGFLFEGNDIASLFPNMANASTWWEWDVWNVESAWLKANAADPVGSNGQHYLDVCNGTGAMYVNSDTTRPTFRFANGTDQTDPPFSGADIHEWNYANLLGYATTGGSEYADVQLLCGFSYVACGPNAAARVEISDNSTYTSATLKFPCDIISWSSQSVQVYMHQGTFANFTGKTVWLTKADNSTRFSAAL
jgi:hypothetical protein